MEKKQKKKYIQIIILGVVVLLMIISTIFTSSISSNIKDWLYKADVKASQDDLVVHFIDVGQGDAIALRFPDDKVMLIDSGTKLSQNLYIEYIKNDVLSSNNDLVIDYLLLTHPDIDHSGGVSAVFVEFEVKHFFRPNIASEDESDINFAMQSTLDEYNEAIKLSKQEKDLQIDIINQKYEFYISGALVQIFPPIREYATTNEMSPIVKVSYLGKSFLFTGDIQEYSEELMIEKYGNILDADVLKVAHHGSETSTPNEFVDVVTPKYAVICVGDNSYGHPHLNVVARLEDAGAKVLTTNGQNVRFVCGHEMFGVLDEDIVHSHEFIDWWFIALIIVVILAIVLVKIILQLIKMRRQKDEN